MELCLIDWRGVWSQPYHTLTYFTIPFVSEKQLNIPKKQFINVMSYLCQIQVTKSHSWEWWTVERFQSNLFRQNPSITKSSLRIQLSRCAQCKKGDSCACWAFWSGPSAKKLHLWISLQHETWTRGKIETRLWKVHDNLAVVVVVGPPSTISIILIRDLKGALRRTSCSLYGGVVIIYAS